MWSRVEQEAGEHTGTGERVSKPSCLTKASSSRGGAVRDEGGEGKVVVQGEIMEYQRRKGWPELMVNSWDLKRR